MASEIRIIEEAKKPLSMHPKKFAMWLFIVSVAMLFAAWTSAYIVKRGEPGWSSFELPIQFWINSIIIVASSLTMVWAHRNLKQDNIEQAKLAISITAILGVAFLIGQFLAWQKMIEMNYYFSGMGSNTSSSFIYVLTGVHGVHIIGGVVYLLILMVSVFKGKVHSKNMTMMDLCATYWHFLDVLWLYLFVFLILNR
ncbi:MAG TPA: cytochrome c oxidase subunit 3 [Chryseosolibacter sp.]|nr:cytochrome c oxidase subunit 3 [Chryseosolibacter sp.]